MRALVCALSGIGNTIATIPLIRALKQLGYIVDVRVSKCMGSDALFTKDEDVENIYDAADARPFKYDVACCTHICAKFHEGCDAADRVMMITPGLVKNFEVESIHRYTKHEIEYCMDHARELGFKGDVPLFTLPREPSGVAVEENTIAIGVGYCKDNDFSHLKHWGNKQFAGLCEMLLDDGLKPLLIGNERDEANVAEIIKLCGREGVRAVTKLTLPQAFDVFVKCRGCVTNETMLVVASASFRIPCLSLVFTEALSNPHKTYPYPSGVALYGHKEETTPKLVFENLKRLVDEGRWIRIQRANDGTLKKVAIRSSNLHCLKRGFGLKGPKVSIVVLVCDFGVSDLLSQSTKCIKKLRYSAPKDSEIIIVANSPSSKLRETIRGVEAEDSRVVSVSTNQNLGVVAKNFAYNLAQGEYIISIDGDVFTTRGWVEKFLAFMDPHPEVALCGPCGGKLWVDLWEPDQWPCGVPQEDSVGDSIFGYEDYAYYGNPTDTGVDGTLLDVIPSMCWCFRRKCLEKVGYLDWRFGPFVGSDADFCFRLKMAGWEVSLLRVPIHHISGGGCSHRAFQDLAELREDHTKALYEKWFPHRSEICEYSTGR